MRRSNLRPVEGATMAKLYDMRCGSCGVVREVLLECTPAGVELLCPHCGVQGPHQREWSVQSAYTWRSPDSPTQAGKPTCVIGEN